MASEKKRSKKRSAGKKMQDVEQIHEENSAQEQPLPVDDGSVENEVEGAIDGNIPEKKEEEEEGEEGEEKLKKKKRAKAGSSIMSDKPFSSLGISEPTMNAIKIMGFENMTEV